LPIEGRILEWNWDKEDAMRRLITALAASLCLVSAAWAQNTTSPNSSATAPLGSPLGSAPTNLSQTPSNIGSQTTPQLAGTHRAPASSSSAAASSSETVANDPVEAEKKEDRLLNEKLNSICRGC
jgi:hypothetical protein